MLALSVAAMFIVPYVIARGMRGDYKWASSVMVAFVLLGNMTQIEGRLLTKQILLL